MIQRDDFAEDDKSSVGLTVEHFSPHASPKIRANSYYTIIMISKGIGSIKTRVSEISFSGNTVFAFSPHEQFTISAKRIEGVTVRFHSDFYCIHRNPGETNCNNILFNNVYSLPRVNVTRSDMDKILSHVTDISQELSRDKKNEHELSLAILKIILIKLTRLKSVQQESLQFPNNPPDQILLALNNLIELNFRKIHAPSQYAALLKIPAASLSRLVKNRLNQTTTTLIAERIIVEAKRELYLTTKTIKEIAYGLGFSDEHYFSRAFKRHTNVSPNTYRSTVGFGRQQRNAAI